MKTSTTLKDNLKYLKKTLNSEDITFLNLKIAKTDAVLIFINDLVNKDAIGELILRPAFNFKKTVNEKNLFDAFFSPEKKQVYTLNDAIDEVLLGNAIVVCDKVESVLSFGLKQFEKRAITEPPTSTVIKGPREGFVESLPVNVSLMRRKLKTEDLCFEKVTIGKYSKTPVALCYISSIADKKLVKQIKEKLKKIEIDAVLDSSYLSKLLGDHKISLFKQIGNTEKPDILAGKILEGRIAIFVDGSPIALTIPYLLIEDFQSASDYYNSPYSATVARFLRLFSVLIALFFFLFELPLLIFLL